jgi:subtilisin family serine protease
MPARQRTLLGLATAAVLTVALAGAAFAQGKFTTGGSSQSGFGISRQIVRPHLGGWRQTGPGVVPPGRYYVDPHIYFARPPGPYIDGTAIVIPPQGPYRPPQRATRRTSIGAPPANERRLVPDEVLIEVSSATSPQQIEILQRRHRLTRIESQPFQLSGTTMFRWRIPDRRSVGAVVRALEADGIVASAQPNYVFSVQQDVAAAAREGDAAQYELAKLRLPQAHSIASGNGVLVAVLDSGVDADHPELAGVVAGTFDWLPLPLKPDKHGTAIAGLIAAHGKLMGAAPGVKILAVRAFNPKAAGAAEGTIFNILKGLDWATANHARIINMSFAGPSDPAIRRSLEAAHKKGIVLIAAAGNAGPKSPPLYPAADPNVIAVTATDAEDKLFPLSNRGRHIAIAAPGAHILVAIPDGGYEVSSGTSYSAAEVTGIVALMLERKRDLTPNQVRAILLATAQDLGPKGRDNMFGAGLADAYGSLMAEGTPLTASVPLPVSRVSAGER